jgi:O-acetyl-ADP-ribose deacetylase (regulator of RNase III)
MITFTTGNLLEEIGKSEAVVNTVNTVGVMGKGIALEFKNRFPDNFKTYKIACNNKSFSVGQMLMHEIDEGNTKYIVNFPTKTHWRYPSKIEYIVKGLDDLARILKEKEIKSIAIPALGCGNGKLNWKDVKPLILNKLDHLKDIEIKVYEPSTKKGKDVTTNKKPRLTADRKILLLLLDQYNNFSFKEKATHVEINHLAYLVNSAKSNAKMDFELKKFGPASPVVNDMLKLMNNYYIKATKQEGKATAIEVKTTKFPQKNQIMSDSTYKNIKEFITGFENENALMTLTVAHWLHFKDKVDINDLFLSTKKWMESSDLSVEDNLIKISVERMKVFYSAVENLKFDI